MEQPASGGSSSSRLGRARKLLPGEFVEVRQKEIGLRGSWHSGVVVKVKYGRRVVEYDELLTLDGLQKLRETIPLGNDTEVKIRPYRNGLNAVRENNDRGFLRPRPPPSIDLPRQCWTKGFLVDAFYEDAWWEGVLLEDIVASDEDTRVKVLFPDEGDELQTVVKYLRVSQDWDEATGEWSVRGHWMSSLSGEADLNALKDIWRHRKSFLKEMWRQKRSRVDGTSFEEEHSFSVLLTQARSAQDEHGSKLEEGYCAPLRRTPSTRSKAKEGLKVGDDPDPASKSTLKNEQLQKLVHDGAQKVSHVLAATEDVEENCLANLSKEEGSVQVFVSNGLPATSRRPCNSVNRPYPPPSGEQDMSSIVPHGLSQVPVIPSVSGGLVRNRAGRLWTRFYPKKSRNNGNYFLLPSNQVSQIKWKRSKSMKIIANIRTKTDRIRVRFARNSEGLEIPYQSNEERLLQLGSCAKQPIVEGHRSRKFPMKNSLNRGDGVTKRGHRLENADKRESQIIGSDDGLEPVSDQRSLHHNASLIRRLLQGARLSAKKVLLDAGWSIVYRDRRGKSKEAIYVTPSGRKFFSLSSACREWKKSQNIQTKSIECESVEVRLLNTYDIQPSTRRKKLHFFCANRKSEEISIGRNTQKKINGVVTSFVSPLNAVPGKISSESSHSKSPSILKKDIHHHSSTEELSQIIVNGIITKGLDGKFPGDYTNGVENQKGCSPNSYKRKFSIFLQEQMALNSSSSFAEHGSGQRIECKRSRPSASEDKAVLVQKTRKRKLVVQDSQFSKEPKCKKSRVTSKLAGSLQENKSTRGRGGCHVQVLLSAPGKDRDPSSLREVGEASHLKKRTVLSWLIDRGVLTENERVCYLSRKDGHVMQEGHVTREGVCCKCCKDVFTLSNFEAHAGSKLHRPCANIFLNDGRSLSQCQMEALNLQPGSKQHGRTSKKKDDAMDSSDDACGVCGDGGELILCDHCPSTFHAGCLGLEVIPEGNWYCPSCRCAVCGGSKFDDNGRKTALRCDQCEREYHVACLRAKCLPRVKQCRGKSWFCGHRCDEIFKDLRGLVGIVNPLEKSLSWTLLRSIEEDQELIASNLEDMAEHSSKLSVALAVMQECFLPMIDPRTKIDIISQVLYNRWSKVNRLNYRGFYTILLERGDELISVATIRVHGLKLAEMPLIGTRFQYRRQGMCRRLMGALEEMLTKLGIEKLILPAVPELLETWMVAFGFKEMSISERRDLMELSLMAMPGTTLLQKQLLIQVPRQAQLAQDCTNDNEGCVERGLLFEAEGGVQISGCLTGKLLGEGSSEGREVCQLERRVSSLRKKGKLGSICAKEEGLPLEQPCLTGSTRGDSGEVTGPCSAFMHVSFCSPVLQMPLDSGNDVLSARSKLKGQNKGRSQSERVLTAQSIEVRSEGDDFYNSKVILTTTRSKRLVKSSRWVADALKELAKDAKHSRQNFCINGEPRISACLEEVAQDTKISNCSFYPGDTGSRKYAQECSQIIENVYIRTRKRLPKPSALMVADYSQRMDDFSWKAKSVVNGSLSLASGAQECDQHAVGGFVTHNKLICPTSWHRSSQTMDSDGVCSTKVSSMTANDVGEEFFPYTGYGNNSGASSCLQAEKGNNSSSVVAVSGGEQDNTKYYSRRRKKDMQQEVALGTGSPPFLFESSFPVVNGDDAQASYEKILQGQVQQPQHEELPQSVLNIPEMFSTSFLATNDLTPSAVEGTVQSLELT